VLDMALLLRVPNMTIFAPSSAEELYVMLNDALAINDGPCAIRYPRGAARRVPPEHVGSGLTARRVREGGDVCILAVGKLVAAAEDAAILLADQGIEATVWDVRVVKPLDPDMLCDAARHPLVVTAEDGVREGGAGSAIADAIADLDEGRQSPPVLVLGTPDRYIAAGDADRIHTELGLDGPGLAASTLKARHALDTARASRATR
jgi:1-deoxy-D-xylulose-5-phosphate synthase